MTEGVEEPKPVGEGEEPGTTEPVDPTPPGEQPAGEPAGEPSGDPDPETPGEDNPEPGDEPPAE